MKKITLSLVILILSVVVSVFYFNNSRADTCGGRCTGSSNCRACSSCNYCKYCNSGGTCGVCSSGSSNSINNSSSIKTQSDNNKNSVVNSSSSSVSKKIKHSTTTYTVKSTILNIRKSPSKSSDIICVIKKHGKIKILKKHDDNWDLVEVVCGGKKIKGFVLRNSLIL